MSLRETEKETNRAVSLSGVLVTATRAGLLFVYWKFQSLSANWSLPLRTLFLVAALSLSLWGLKQLITGLWSGARKEQRGLQLTRHRVMLPGQGLVYLLIMMVAFIGSLLGRSNMLMLVFAMMAGPFILNGWIVFSMLKRTTVRRLTPRRAMAGEPVSVEIGLENRRWSLSSWLMSVSDQIANRSESLEAVVLFSRVPPGNERNGHYQMRLMQRGRYTFGPIYLSSRFPLGLVERGLVMPVADSILIYPRLGRLSPSWKRDHFLAADLVHRHELRRGAFDDEFHRIREYRWGDNPRAIHWRTSARLNELMVREYHQSRDQTLIVLLDLWRPRHADRDALDRVELAVSFAATVCVEQMRHSRDSNLFLAVAGDRLTQWEGRSGPASIESVLDTLALVDAGPAPAVEKLMDEAAGRRGPATRTVLITTRPRIDGRISGLDQAGTKTATELAGDIHVIQAAPEELAPFFHLD